MRFRRQFAVAAPVDRVLAFHRRAASLRALTPPLGPVRVRAPERSLAAGDEIELRFWVGPVPVRWLAAIEAMGPDGFVDRQVSGPFRRWEHRHRFAALPEGGTRVLDEVDAELRRHPLWAPVGLLIWLGLPLLFAFRAWRTRGMLAESTP